MLRWAPATFWASTLHDLTAALDGYLESRGIDPKAPSRRRQAIDDLLTSPAARPSGSIRKAANAVRFGG